MMVVTGVLTQEQAFDAIDLNVIFLLAGMMALANILGRTGFFALVGIRAAKLAGGRPYLLMALLATITAVLSAVLDNVTTVVLLAPVTLYVATVLGVSPDPVPDRARVRVEHRRRVDPRRRPTEHPHRLRIRPRLRGVRHEPGPGHPHRVRRPPRAAAGPVPRDARGRRARPGRRSRARRVRGHLRSPDDASVARRDRHHDRGLPRPPAARPRGRDDRPPRGNGAPPRRAYRARPRPARDRVADAVLLRRPVHARRGHRPGGLHRGGGRRPAARSPVATRP